jgi:hypothetical protein
MIHSKQSLVLKNGIFVPRFAFAYWKRYYQQGYEEGFADGLKSGPDEGYEFGHEVAFQKFLPLGIILGRCAIWKHSISPNSPHPLVLLEPKRARVLKQIELLEDMILNLDKENESEADHGKFERMKNKILNKCRVVESLIGQERLKQDSGKEQEDHISLAKRMDRELQL